VDPNSRKHSPDFYGYIPDGGGRTVIFGCMMLNCALLLLIRSFSAAMLMLVEKRYFLLYLAGDMALYLLQKVLRGDFHYWMPVGGALGLLTSLLMRVIVKVLSDFTGVVHFRGPQELGGVYWTANMFLAVVASLACVWIGGGERIHWTLVGAASGAWVLVFGIFLLLMKKDYRRTFFSTQTGKQQVMERFSKADDEAIKSSIFKKNYKMWRPIREDVKEWVQANWWRWKEEKPGWFDLAWQSKVPKEWITDVEERARLDEVRKRRGSVVGSVKQLVNVFVKAEEEVRGGTRVEPVA